MRRPLAAALLALVLTGCGGGEEAAAPATSTTTEEPVEETPEPEAETTTQAPEPVATGPGELAVYERIAELTDCAAVQGEFDTASANFDRVQAGSPEAQVSLDYMRVADERLAELDCY